jgi:selenocysteine lyase/cysteine desulfurase
VGAALGRYAAQGVGAFLAGHAQRVRLKGRLATLFGGDATDYALVPNTTAGLIAVARSFPWAAGDRVVVFRGEFPTNVTPWQRAAESFGLELVFVDLAPLAAPGGADLGPLETALRGGVRLVALSAVQFQTGLRAPLEAIAALCRAHGAALCIDGIQAAGVLPLDFTAFDFVAVGGHKWMMGPEGAGFLYVHPDRAAALRPVLTGWLSHQDAADFLFESGKLRYDKPFRPTADALEAGAPNTIGYAGLEAAVDTLAQLGIPAIAAHVAAYLAPLEAGLVALGFESARLPDAGRRSGILSVRVPSDVTLPALASELGARGLAISTPDGHLRFAPHWPNALDEVPEVLAAVDEALRALR